MSLRAMLWVMESAPVENHGELAVLYALAERAHDDGSCAWPSQEWIAWRARCTDRTVRNHLKALEQRGVIRRGNPKFVEHIRRDPRPIVWNLDLTLQRPENNDRKNLPAGKSESNDRKNQAERPENLGRTTGNRFPTNRPEPSMNRPEPLSATEVAPAENRNDPFDDFWAVYPRKADKKKAHERWGEAILTETPENIIDAARKFREEKTGVERQYIKLPSTWLNQQCWQDYQELSVVDKWKERVGGGGFAVPDGF